ncbi:polysaccharide biosynthesis protein [Dactylosporangium aurantiacum]|uniref:Polysaccharide biosynthesis protein n=1 Tax=Dactylosporangium aurantiacum TaxID=35754 RepID=A0A9Q9MJW9_9ACTN|nr:nucleoside-diphosphate sugar epimerase/dehydratase [Dactylosporangium aurantiacum]MDG6100833.1 nucleoside-diphosphate sugar epimerase/dehydratase [Dactylosporangium aurantiacum]UWZ55106.1 polysaccharide biosynthesis protein [Dactylosporangium aurantiacum]
MDEHRPSGPADWPADLCAWAGGLALAVTVAPAPPSLFATGVAVVLAAALHTVTAWPVHLYRRRYGRGTLPELRALALTVAVTGGLLWALGGAQAAVAVPGAMTALLAMVTGRATGRLRRERRRRVAPATGPAVPALVFGAGAAGHRLLRSMAHDPHCRYRPVGLIDDDPAKRNLRVEGVAVLGGRACLIAAIERTGAQVVIFAIRAGDGALLRDVRAMVTATGRELKVLPSINETLDGGGPVGVAQVRDVRLSDLLGRRQIDTDLEAIGDYLTGRRVLVTGAGGSIGSELCRQLHRFAPAELMMLDRDESALHAVQLSIHGRALLDSPELILADLRDAASIAAIFAERRPEVVFHAAALKHLTLLERHPAEAVQTNVLGTLNVLSAAAAVGVERFVNISTDKAANPVSVLGYSKRITERLTAHRSTVAAGTYLNVRFGNVLGSRGSVVTAFQAQIAAGGPVTVTDPEVTRFMMTVQEAVQLVIQAAALGAGGEALVLDMGSPVRIDELAHQLAAQAERPVDFVYTGLRPGEKLHEELFGDGETDLRPLHPLISHVSVPPLDPALALALDVRSAPGALVGQLADLCVVPHLPQVPDQVPDAATALPTLSAARTS